MAKPNSSIGKNTQNAMAISRCHSCSARSRSNAVKCFAVSGIAAAVTARAIDRVAVSVSLEAIEHFLHQSGSFLFIRKLGRNPVQQRTALQELGCDSTADNPLNGSILIPSKTIADPMRRPLLCEKINRGLGCGDRFGGLVENIPQHDRSGEGRGGWCCNWCWC